MAAPAADLPGISDGFRRLRRHTEAVGDMSAAAQDVRARQYERVCENFRILRRKYDALKEVHQELLWGDAVLAHEGLAAGLPAVDPALVEEAHRVGDVTTAATLGSGACSSVLEGAWPDGRPCAVKRISKRDAKTLQEVRNVASELEALRALTGSPHALELQAVFASRDHLYFVVERFGEELYALLKRDEFALAPAQKAGVVHGVAAGLAHMHSLDLVHRDVKPENVLLADVVPGGGFRDVRVKLCDLGLSTRVRAAPSPACVTATLAAGGRAAPPRGRAARAPLFQCCGSMGFFAPDMLDPAGYDGWAADAWSLGCLALELAAGARLFARVWFREYKSFFARRGDRNGEHGRFVANLAPLARALRGCGELAAEPDVARDLEDCRALCRQSPAFAGAAACLDADPGARRTPAEARDALAATHARRPSDASADSAASRGRVHPDGAPADARPSLASSLRAVLGGREASSPVAPEAPEAAAAAAAPEGPAAPPAAPAPASARRLLVVDDEPASLLATRDALRAAYGCRVDAASTALDALDALESEAYDAVLVELGLGGVGGAAVVAAASNRADGDRPFVAALARGAGALPDAADLGADVVARAPLDAAVLRGAHFW